MLVAAMALAACGGSGPVHLTPPTQSTTAICAKLIAALPGEVRELKRRNVSPASDRTAAWGDPPITLLCGVPQPAALQAHTTLLTINGVGWFSQRLTRGMRFTSIGREADVEVDVPEDYTEPTDALTDLTEAMRAVPVAV